ncbi:MAG TPA: SGNH/GDSL hydrolase family protein [Gemmatimonadaceae bacterium]|nr:SGNH/GDSL hydrolase family protein [Gemmatimonadaceae bacterium]
MFSKHHLVGGAAAVLAAALLAACTSDKNINMQTPVDPLFKSYASLGNSITAGYQSGGINDSTQMQSYAVLFAAAANTRFAIPDLAMPGCPPPINDFLAQTRVGGGTSSTCALRTPSSVTWAINNVAVPGATSLDPTSLTTSASNALTTFILGGQTQVQRASQVVPTFVSMWIGNNDALAAALAGVLVPTSGVSPGLTDSITFVKNYKADINSLLAVTSIKGGVLFAVVDVTNAPLLFHSNLLFTPYKAEFDAFAGAVTAVDPSCQSNVALIDFQLAGAIRAGAHPAAITCVPAPYPVGVYVLDSIEVGKVQQTVAAYNRYIKAKADSIGWAYVDVNPALQQLRLAGAIPPFPYPVPDTAFGTYFSLDGVHPSAKAHKLVANTMIDSVNAKYGTSLSPIP